MQDKFKINLDFVYISVGGTNLVVTISNTD